MINLFVSIKYVGRLQLMYDEGFHSYIIEDRKEPDCQEGLEQLNEEIRLWMIEWKRLDAASIDILYFKEV
jgi:hypothetical protein